MQQLSRYKNFTHLEILYPDEEATYYFLRRWTLVRPINLKIFNGKWGETKPITVELQFAMVFKERRGTP